MGFQFTTSQGGRRTQGMKRIDLIVFQFTTSQGGRHSLEWRDRRFWWSFNSRPHKEVDFTFSSEWSGMVFQFTTSQGGRPRRCCPGTTRSDLSIHDLTRRSTEQGNRTACCIGLSIHDLTRRSTIKLYKNFPKNLSFNSRPHKEVDQFPASDFFVIPSFNSRPHKEVDQMSRLRRCLSGNFQFTTSQGGRH